MARRESEAEIAAFMRRYGRRGPSHASGDPNDRQVSHKLAQRIKRLDPTELDQLLRGVDESALLGDFSE